MRHINRTKQTILYSFLQSNITTFIAPDMVLTEIV